MQRHTSRSRPRISFILPIHVGPLFFFFAPFPPAISYEFYLPHCSLLLVSICQSENHCWSPQRPSPHRTSLLIIMTLIFSFNTCQYASHRMRRSLLMKPVLYRFFSAPAALNQINELRVRATLTIWISFVFGANYLRSSSETQEIETDGRKR